MAELDKIKTDPSVLQLNITAQERRVISEKIKVEIVRFLFRQNPAGLFGNLICGVVLFIGLYQVMNHQILFSWFIALLIVTFLRLTLLLAHYFSSVSKVWHYWLFIIGAFISGSLWGIIDSILMPTEGVYQAFIIIIVAGVSAGGSVSLSPSRLASSLFVFSMILPLAIWLLTRTDEIYILIGIAMLVYLIYIMAAAFRNNNLLIRTLRLSYENTILAEYLANAKSSVEKINKDLVTEIAQRKNIEEQLKYLATHDNLTGIMNRNYLYTRLREVVTKAKHYKQKFALLFLDLDGFKHINDEYGHDVGDQFLKQVAKRLEGCLRATDIIARFGGDEFIIVFENITTTDFLEARVKKIQLECIPPINIGGRAFKIILSIGIAIYPEDGDDVMTLLKNADKAMYTIKQAGGNNFMYSRDIPLQ